MVPVIRWGTGAVTSLNGTGYPGMMKVHQHNLTTGGKMRKLLILGVLAFAAVAPVRAQDYPKAEVFGGYQYIRVSGGTNCQGFGGAAAGNVNNWLGVAGDFGYCKVTGLPSGAS